MKKNRCLNTVSISKQTSYLSPIIIFFFFLEGPFTLFLFSSRFDLPMFPSFPYV